MKKVLTIFLCFILFISLPACNFIPKLTICGELLKLICEQFNLNNFYFEEPYFEQIPTSDEYFQYAQICFERKLLEEGFSLQTGDTICRGQIAKIILNLKEFSDTQLSEIFDILNIDKASYSKFLNS